MYLYRLFLDSNYLLCKSIRKCGSKNRNKLYGYYIKNKGGQMRRGQVWYNIGMSSVSSSITQHIQTQQGQMSIGESQGCNVVENKQPTTEVASKADKAKNITTPSDNVRSVTAINGKEVPQKPIPDAPYKPHPHLGRDFSQAINQVLNPKELPIVHQYYSPSPEEVEWALEMVKLAEEAVREGAGVAVKEGKFVGPPMVKMAKKILAKHEKICCKTQQM